MFKFGLVEFNIQEEDDALLDAFNFLNGKRVDSPDWDILWYYSTDPPPSLYHNIDKQRRINHIPGCTALADKWLLFQNLERRYGSNSTEQKNTVKRFYPHTWRLPEDREELSSNFKNNDTKPLIIKSKKGSYGQGMHVVNSIKALPQKGSWLAQEYLNSPHLINRSKYNIRVFVLITDTKPFTAYLYHDAIIDINVQPYSKNSNSFSDQSIHIANTGVQCKQKDLNLEKHFLNLQKWLSLLAIETDSNKVWQAVKEVIKKTFLAGADPIHKHASKKIAHSEQCFELFGLDLMLDDELNPWIIECNRTPSMSPKYSGPLKFNLLKDTLGLILERRSSLSEIDDSDQKPEPLLEFGNFKRLI